ncbi:MAG: hypothetical protein E7253_09530 [Lachnospiraceae bacterium]|nr:hypothetical protein [Lachnospiraceae bacterium]
MKKDIITVKEGSDGGFIMFFLFIVGIIMIGSALSFGDEGWDAWLVVLSVLFLMGPLLSMIRIWNWHLYIYEDDSLRFINWRGKIINFHLRDIKIIEKRKRYNWNSLAGPEESIESIKIKDVTGRCLCTLDPSMSGFNKFELWAKEKKIPIHMIEKNPMEKRSHRKYYLGHKEEEPSAKLDDRIIKRLRIASILLPIGYFILYLYWFFTWKNIIWIHIAYCLTIYILCVVYHEYISAETPLFIEKGKYQQWKKSHTNFCAAMLVSGYLFITLSDSGLTDYEIIKGNWILLAILLFFIMAAAYFYVAWEDGYVNHIVMVLFLLFFCGTIMKPFLLTFVDDAFPNPGYGIVVEKHEESGDDWSAKYIKVELDSGRKVTFQTVYPGTYEQCRVNGAIQLYVWEVPFGFEIACLAEYP